MVKLKVCGMKYEENIEDLSALLPDYMGFIFYPRSKRFFEGNIPALPQTIKKTGVFVDEELNHLVDLIERHQLDAIQLHGDESVDYIKELRQMIAAIGLDKVEMIKAFAIGENFDFQRIEAYGELVNYFLFDTKGKEKGGNGIAFDWNILSGYTLEKPYFLSGGIGLDSIDRLKYFLGLPWAKHCQVLDLNSKFEEDPGVKNIELIEEFTKALKAL